MAPHPLGFCPDTPWFPAVRGSGVALQGAALLPAPTAPPAGLSVLPSGTVFTFPAASDPLSPHCPVISPSSPPPSPPAPHPSSSLRDDPGLGSLPAHPWSVSSIHLCRQVRVPSRGSQRFTPTSSPGSAHVLSGCSTFTKPPTTWQGQASGLLRALLCVLLYTQA